MTERNVVLGVDLDGVCADFYGQIREIAAEWFEKSIDELTTDVSYGLHEWGITGEKYESLHRFAVTERNLFRDVPMIPGARKYLRQLSDEGFHIRIVTHRLFIQYFHAIAVQQTIEWLDHHGIPYLDLCFMKQKRQVGADIYVEDSPDNIDTLRKAGLFTICFGNSTNRDIVAPRAENWADAYTLIKQQAAELMK